MRRDAAARALIASIALAGLGGCQTPGVAPVQRTPPARSAAEIGNVNMAVISVTRWQDVAGDLESKFPVTESQLLAEAAPITSTVTDRVLDVAMAKLGISVAGPDISKTQTYTGAGSSNRALETENGETTATQSSSTAESTEATSTRALNTPDSAPTADVVAGGAAGIGTPPAARNTGVDAFTRYTAANALRQELVILNRYVRDAAQRSGYEPFLVRMQFGVQPRLRNQPLDAFMRVSFLPNVTAVSQRAAPSTSPESAFLTKPASSEIATLFSARPARRSTTTERADSYQRFAQLFDRFRAGSQLSGLSEDGADFWLDLQSAEGVVATFVIAKPCFFRNLGHYLSVRHIKAERTYIDLAGSARFASTFFAQLEQDPAVFARTCGDDPGELAGLRAEFDRWVELRKTRMGLVPIVVPLVVTDNIEGTRDYQAVQQLRQAALALSAVGGPVNANAGFGRTLDRLREYEAISLNSIYSISRLGENTLQVRIGASRFGGHLEMVPRTVQSTALVLVPKEQAGGLVNLVARPSFNNAVTGRVLPLSDNNRRVNRHLEELAERECSTWAGGEGRDACVEGLETLAAYTEGPNAWMAFLDKLKTYSRQYCTMTDNMVYERCVLRLWTELDREEQLLRATTTASVEIPGIRVRDLPRPQTAVARSTKTAFSISLVGIDPWLKPDIRARSGIDRNCQNGSKTAPGYAAPAATVNGDVGTFSFPRKDGGAAPEYLCLWLENSSYAPMSLGLVEGFSADTPRVYPIDLVHEEKDPPAPFKLVGPNQAMLTEKNKGVARLEIRDLDKKQLDRVRLTADGGIIVEAAGATLEKTAFAASVTEDAAVALTLDSLDTDGRKVRIVAQGMKGAAKVGEAASFDVRIKEGASK